MLGHDFSRFSFGFSSIHFGLSFLSGRGLTVPVDLGDNFPRGDANGSAESMVDHRHYATP
jgi:hypothetical protein